MLSPYTNLTILFQGDSVTDAGRSRTNDAELGGGYPMFIQGQLSATHPAHNITILNRGISGDRTIDLVNRWTEDCIELKPDVVSILIGVNDTWRRYDSNDPTSTEEYARNFGTMLERVKTELDAKIVIIEPFVLPVSPAQNDWREDLDPKIHVARALAQKYDAIYIPMDGIFASAACHTGLSYWASDGVHPTSAGHSLIAQSWLKATGLA
ncbi:MAG: SGNH/GDSL hydrolase family protein [Armatimonadota bacterium]